MIEKLVSRVFYTRNFAHWAHWRTKNYARHMALGDFYDGVIDALDALVEAHQGVNGLIGQIPTPDQTGTDILLLLKNDAAWVEKNHEQICGGNRAIANLLDGITGVYLSAIYKLETFT